MRSSSGPAPKERSRPSLHRVSGPGRVGEACAVESRITADQSAQAQLLAEAVGTPKLIRDEVAAPLGRTRAFGGFSFRPYFDVIVAEQPDLLD
jgi:hypothetical protein